MNPSLSPYLVLVIFFISTFCQGENDLSSDTCHPSDFERISSACDGATGTREVRYIQRRNCSNAINFGSQRIEPCACSPEDYIASYVTDEGSKQCLLTYVPKNCTGGSPTNAVAVDSVFCSVAKKACTEANIRSTYLSCDSATQEVEVVYYFDDKCNPESPGSVRLPPSSFIPCNLHCGAGSRLVGKTCQKCGNGTFSIGGGIRLQGFTAVDSSLFQTTCTYKTKGGASPCTPWHAEGEALKAGPYDQANEYFQDECTSDPSLKCHNSLQSALTMNVKLVRDGYLRFLYTVEAERGYDGLAFYLDQNKTPAMDLDSYQYTAKERNFSLAAGYHTLTWMYLKDEKWTRGKDSASIILIEIDGTDFNDQTCTPCPPGTFSERGANSCLPCPLNTFSNHTGTTQCTACPSTQYSLKEPRINCTVRPACVVSKDASASFEACRYKSNKMKKTYHWLEPRICRPTSPSQLPAPSWVQCPGCAPGQVPVKHTSNGTSSCQLCPAGNVRSPSMVVCHRCQPGSAAVRELTLAHFPSSNGSLPAGFVTGCSGQCGGGGWRPVNGALNSGSGHGNTVSVWLALNVSLEMEGQVWFNYSVDIADDDTQRGLFFYIDDELADDIEEEDVVESVQQSGPWPLPAGNHSLMWLYIKLNADPDFSASDSAIIHEIKVRGEGRGGAEKCKPIPQGNEAVPGGNAWRECPAGTYGAGGLAPCKPCAANTYNPTPKGISPACLPCPSGTSSLPNSTECSIGDASIPSSFCTFSVHSRKATADTSARNLTVFDLSPLDRLHPGRMFGPVYANASTAPKQDDPSYFFSPCSKLRDNASCVDFSGNPVYTYACRSWGVTTFEGVKRPSHSLGDSVSLLPLSNNPHLQKRGLILLLKGAKCPFGNEVRTTELTLICDPDSGYGSPEPWTSGALSSVFNPSSGPPWADRSGRALPIEQNDYCTYRLVWYSAFACPLCGEEDWEEVHVRGCVGNKKSIFQYREPKVCQANALSPLPADVPCQLCTPADIIKHVDQCVDARGRHNVTYSWRQPVECNPAPEGSAKLPADILAGACVQNVTLVTLAGVGPGGAAGIALGCLMIVLLSAVSVHMYLKNRRIYSEYTKLLHSERPGDFSMEEGRVEMADEDSDNEGESGGKFSGGSGGVGNGHGGGVEKSGEEGEEVGLRGKKDEYSVSP